MFITVQSVYKYVLRHTGMLGINFTAMSFGFGNILLYLFRNYLQFKFIE